MAASKKTFGMSIPFYCWRRLGRSGVDFSAVPPANLQLRGYTKLLLYGREGERERKRELAVLSG